MTDNTKLTKLPEPDICHYVVTVWRDGVECEIDKGPRYTVEQMQAYAREAVRLNAQAQQPLTDEQCDAIYMALDNWAREFDEYEFGLPHSCGGGVEGGREIIRQAHKIGVKNELTN